MSLFKNSTKIINSHGAVFVNFCFSKVKSNLFEKFLFDNNLFDYNLFDANMFECWKKEFISEMEDSNFGNSNILQILTTGDYWLKYWCSK